MLWLTADRNNGNHATGRSSLGPVYYVKSFRYLPSLFPDGPRRRKRRKRFPYKILQVTFAIFLDIQLYPARIRGRNSRAPRDYRARANVLGKLLAISQSVDIATTAHLQRYENKFALAHYEKRGEGGRRKK